MSKIYNCWQCKYHSAMDNMCRCVHLKVLPDEPICERFVLDDACKHDTKIIKKQESASDRIALQRNKVLHNVQVFKHMRKYNGDKWKSYIEVVCADVYKISFGSHSRLICAFRNKSTWIPMDVLTGIVLQGNFTTKTAALHALTKHLGTILNPEYPVMIVHALEKFNRAEKELFKALDENQKVCYNKLVDLCEN